METDLSKKVSASLGEIVDEETTRRFGELNIITEVSETAPGAVKIKFQPLSAYSPLAVNTGRDIRRVTLAVEGVSSVRVECNGHMMDELVNKLVNKEDKAETAPK